MISLTTSLLEVARKADKEDEKTGICWSGYKRVPGTKPYSPGSCEKKADMADPDLEKAGKMNPEQAEAKPKKKGMTAAKRMDLGTTVVDGKPAEVVSKAPMAGNPNVSDPATTDTMQEDPTVDGLKQPVPYFDIMQLRHPANKLRTPGGFLDKSTTAPTPQSV